MSCNSDGTARVAGAYDYPEWYTILLTEYKVDRTFVVQKDPPARNRKHRLHSPCCQCRDALLGACSQLPVCEGRCSGCTATSSHYFWSSAPSGASQLHTHQRFVEDPSYGDLMPPKLPKTSFCCSCKHGLCLGPHSYSARQGCSRLSRAIRGKGHYVRERTFCCM